jgi:hypothetical protein
LPLLVIRLQVATLESQLRQNWHQVANSWEGGAIHFTRGRPSLEEEMRSHKARSSHLPWLVSFDSCRTVLPLSTLFTTPFLRFGLGLKHRDFTSSAQSKCETKYKQQFATWASLLCFKTFLDTCTGCLLICVSSPRPSKIAATLPTCPLAPRRSQS